MTALFSLLLVCFLCIGFVEMYLYTRHALLQKSYDFMHGEAVACSTNIEETIRRMEDVSLGVLGNNTVQVHLRQKRFETLGQREEYTIHQKIREILGQYALLYQEIHSISLTALDGTHYQYLKYNDNAIPSEERLKEISGMIYAKAGETLWYSADTSYTVLTCAQAIYDLSTYSTLGYTSVNISEAQLRALYSTLISSGTGYAYLLDERGVIISSYDGNNLGLPYRQLNPSYQVESGEYYQILENGDSIYISHPFSNSWQLVLSVPSSYYLSSLTFISKVFLLSAIVTTVLGYIAVYQLTRHTTKPIAQLGQAMRQFGQGNTQVQCPSSTCDEIGDLGHTFNQMARDLSRLYRETYAQRLLQQETELRALQMQINPHFLYNTLDTINWKARLQGVDEVGEMAYCLGYLLRCSLSEGNLTTLEQEIEHLKIYLKIQQIRYGEKLHVMLEVDPIFYCLELPKLVIQPLVENAIIHGVEKKLTPATICLWVEEGENEDIHICIEDDGPGMSDQEIGALFIPESRQVLSSGSHIGLNNVDQRLKMYYGDAYGVSVRSKLGHGTCITLHISKQVYHSYKER